MRAAIRGSLTSKLDAQGHDESRRRTPIQEFVAAGRLVEPVSKAC
jgi:hypothetical protein